MSNTPISQVLGKIPSGLFVVTIRREELSTGMVVSWVMQAGFQPPSISLAVQKDRYIAEWLVEGLPFVLNILAKRDKALLQHFARGFAPGQPAFEGLEIELSSRGVPILDHTVGFLECVPGGFVDSGDHRVFVAEVIDGRLRPGEEPFVHIRKSGAGY
jgi:flavin reductase (DIM6/NTAB) family NADH-FMN oxidoreductase RutF